MELLFCSFSFFPRHFPLHEYIPGDSLTETVSVSLISLLLITPHVTRGLQDALQLAGTFSLLWRRLSFHFGHLLGLWFSRQFGLVLFPAQETFHRPSTFLRI